ncbi:hypothetical protein [Dyadobacter diqingensis]|uniref:hypothetical protein n=1 Tax=Dyadobacter diqingensis TaxID=2938121 RepID=UPI0020C19DA6|nr:hypothetical protein [Dyadobacter diqingensis]
MPSPTIEIKITKEVDGSDLDLNNMSLRAAKSLVVILEALNRMIDVESSAENRAESDVKISVKSGSACVAIVGEDVREIQANIIDVINRDSQKGTYLEEVRNIQKVITANGLTYESSFQFDNETYDFVEILKSIKPVRSPRRKNDDKYYDIKFITGKLIENGGKKPNIHVEVEGVKQKISCDEKQAQKVNNLLYSTVMLSAWTGMKSDGKIYYEFCDNYLTKDLYDEFRLEIAEIMNGTGTEPLLRIHEKFKNLIVNQRFGEARKFVRLFTHHLVDKHKMRSMLVASKAFKENGQFKDLISIIVKHLENKTGKKLF